MHYCVRASIYLRGDVEESFARYETLFRESNFSEEKHFPCGKWKTFRDVEFFSYDFSIVYKGKAVTFSLLIPLDTFSSSRVNKRHV